MVGRPFQKGQSGNPGGVRKHDPEVKELAKVHTGDAVRTLATIMANGKAPAAARVSAATAILERGWGKPLQQLEVKTSPLDELSPDELSAVGGALSALAADARGTAH